MQEVSIEEIKKAVLDGKSHLCWDSRLIKPGNVFVALKTSSNDGHNYVKEAQDKGATMAIVEALQPELNIPQCLVKCTWAALRDIAASYRDLFDGPIIGITGSCGKTSTKDLLALLLGEGVHKTIETENNLLGVPKTLLEIDLKKTKYVIVECGTNEEGEMQKISECLKPNHAIITNIEPVHLEGLKSLQNIANEKAFLFRNTMPDGVRLLPESCLKYSYYNINKNNFYWISDKKNDVLKNSIVYEIKAGEDGNVKLKVGGIGEYEVERKSEGMMRNVVLAISMAYILGITEEEIQERLKRWKASELRGEIIERNRGVIFSDCYNSNPVALLDSQKYYKERFGRYEKHLYVLGCMGELGEESAKMHYETGSKLILNQNDKVIIQGDHGEKIKEGIMSQSVGCEVLVESNRENIKKMINEFEGGVFVKGSKRYRLWELLPNN